LIRGLAILTIIIIASLLGGFIFQTFQHNTLSDGRLSTIPAIQDPINVTGTTSAFNYTYGTADIYAIGTALQTPSTPATGTTLVWFSTFNSTSTGSTIPGTAFNFTSSSPISAGRQEVNWTLTIPKTTCSTCSVYVQFTLYGNLTKGTSENFTLTLTHNNTLIPTTICQGSPQGSCVFLGDNASSANPVLVCGTTTSTLLCPTSNPVQVNATRWVGYKLSLSFRFGWNGTAEPMKASVGEVRVASIDNMIKTSTSHLMWLNTTDTVVHRAALSQISYNATVEYPANGTSTTVSHIWSNEVINILYPSGYNITKVLINSTSSGTITLWQSNLSVPAAFEKTSCQNIPCSQSLLALNMSYTNPRFIHNSNVTITAVTRNSIMSLATLSGGVSTQLFTSGDQISIKVVNKPSIVNASTSLQTGTLRITFPSALSIPTGTVSTATGGVYNFTLPSDCGPNNELCSMNWSFSAVFISPYDLGNATGSFRINSLQVSFTGSTGASNALSVQGRLTYGDGTAASRVNATLFAVDRGTPVNTPVTTNQTTISSTLLYISNVTLVNGVFTQGEPLIMLFTVVNPDPTQLYNATITIEHEWPGPQPHNMSVTFSLHPGDPLGDLPFGTSGPQTYKATILFTGTGVQVTLTNLRTSPNSETSTMTPGTSPVVPNRPHAGLFNLTLTSKIGNTTETPSSFIISPTYAYVSSSLVPSRYLAASNLIATDPNGDFSATISSHFLLGAKNLVVFLLARDATGIGLVNSLSSIALTDSTTLLSTTDSIGTVVKDQTVTATLHLTSNSTKITEVITVNLVLQGNGMSPQTVGTKTDVTILPGESQTVTLTFPAPSTVGSYTLTFFSPEYGGPLTSQTLQVTILQSNLQILIPAAIGVVAAIIILGIYLVRRQPETGETEEKTKPAGSKPKIPGSRNPSKSLTRTQDHR